MTTPSDLKEEANKDPVPYPNYVSVLYGDYGKRKTTTACSMVKEKGLLLCSDDSWKVLLNDRHKDLIKKIKIIVLEGLSQLKYIDYDGYDTIIWDTISRSVASYLDLLKDHAKWVGNNREKLITTHPDLKNLESLGLGDYRVTRDTFRPILEPLFKTNSNLIFTSQMTEPIPGLGKDQRNRPSVPAATFTIIAERADIIAQIRPVSRKFVVDMSENSISQLGKSRIQGLEGAMDLDNFVTTYKEIVF